MKLADRLMEFLERKNKTKQYHNDGSIWEMTKVGKYYCLPAQLIAYEKEMVLGGEVRALRSSSRSSEGSMTHLNLKTTCKRFIKSRCEKTYFKCNAKSLVCNLIFSLLSVSKLIFQAGIRFFGGTCERYIYHLGLDVRTTSWNDIIGETIEDLLIGIRAKKRSSHKNSFEPVFSLKNMDLFEKRKMAEKNNRKKNEANRNKKLQNRRGV